MVLFFVIVMQVSSDIEIEKEEDEGLSLPDEQVCFCIFFFDKIVAKNHTILYNAFVGIIFSLLCETGTEG